jgi:hypothetical protein
MDTAAPSGDKMVQDGLRLMRAFLKISDLKIRAEVIDFVEIRADEAPPKPLPFKLDPRE